MRIGIVQPNYVPWRGYIDFIDDVDLFILLDTVQYTDRDWRNRNKIKTTSGTQWISVPVKYTYRNQPISEIKIFNENQWQKKQLNLLKQNYSISPFFSLIEQNFQEIISREHEFLTDLNLELLNWINSMLSVSTPIIRASELASSGTKSERLISLVQAVGGTHYLSGPAAADYLDLTAFQAAGIHVEYKTQ